MEKRTPSPPGSGAARTARYRENMKKKGYVQVFVWVPPDKSKTIQLMAQQFRAGK
jgi:hypothetical protein